MCDSPPRPTSRFPARLTAAVVAAGSLVFSAPASAQTAPASPAPWWPWEGGPAVPLFAVLVVAILFLGFHAFRAARVRDTLIRTVADLRASEAKLRETERSLSSAQHIARLGSWTWNIRTGELWWSDEIFRIFGLIPHSFGASYDAFLAAVHPDDRKAVGDAVNHSLETRKPYDIEHRILWPDGTLRHVHEQGEATYDDAGRPVELSGTVQDITQRKLAEREIQLLNETLENKVAERTRQMTREKERAETYLAIAGTMIVALDGGGRVQLVNRKGAEVLGYEQDDLIGRDWFDAVLPADQRAEVRSVFARIQAGDLEPVATYENEVVTRTGERRLVRWNNAYLRGGDGAVAGVLSSGEDITEQRAAERALRSAKDQAERANKAKSDFLSNMSHELRTPLNAILGFAQLMETDTREPLGTKQKDSVDYILRSGNHLLDLINEILDLSRIESGKLTLSLETVNPDHVFGECLELTRALAEKRGIAVHGAACDLESPIVTADYTRLKQVLLNLISNAIKYNRENGSISLSCGAGDPGFLRISISDTGHGIPRDRYDELFQPFSRLGQENSGIEGTGIGLSLTKRLVELMNGRIGFESTAGRGSTFWIDLPSEAPSLPDAAPPARRPSLRAVDPNESVILYVEDNPSNLTLMENIIERLDGIQMISAHTAELGLELALAHHPDVIILDINLPGMDGYQALSKIRSYPEIRDTPVLALSANAMPRDVEKGLRAGFKEYLTKPARVADIHAALNRSLEQVVKEGGPAEPAEKDKSVTGDR